MKKTKKVSNLTPYARDYMNRIEKLCEKHQAKLILYSSPSPKNYNYKKYNALKRYAKEHHLPYLDMNLKLNEVGIDWKTDSLDAGDHLNLSGAQKTTDYLGVWLKQSEHLKDHRGNPNYRAWNLVSDDYQKQADDCLKRMTLPSAA